MADDFNHANVMKIAVLIGAITLGLGLIGVILNLSTV